MIVYQEKGLGLFSFLQERGADLYQLNGVWSYQGTLTPEEVNNLIELYNPWPSMKAIKLSEINLGFSNMVGQLVSGSTPDERNSWAIQESEARAWKLDNNTPTPALSVLSASRGIPLSTLADKVLEKAALYKQHYFTFQGVRDRAEDMLKSLPDEGQYERLSELDSIYFGV